MFLRPGSTFKIVWQTADPNDANTYYPRVNILKSLDSTVLDGPFNLALESAGRYSYNWQVPNDPTGQGLQIDMTVIVYTDAGHTTVSGNYNKENRIYTIFDLAAALLRTGGGDNTDYQLIEKLIKREVGKIVIPNYTENLKRLFNTMTELHKVALFTHTTLTDKNNGDVLEKLGGHETMMGNLFTAIKAMPKLIAELKEVQETSGQTMLEGLQNLAEVSGKGNDKALEAIKQLPTYGKELADILETAGKAMSALKILNKAFLSVETITVNKARGMELPEVEETKPAKKDYLALAKNLV